MDRLPAFVSSWITRYLLTALTAFGTIWGATKEETAGAAAYLGGLIIFLLLAGLRWIKNRLLRKNGIPVGTPITGFLPLLCVGILTVLPSCRAVGRALITTGAATVDVATKPDAWRRQLPSPMAQIVMAPLTFTASAVGAIIGVPTFIVGAAIGGLE